MSLAPATIAYCTPKALVCGGFGTIRPLISLAEVELFSAMSPTSKFTPIINKDVSGDYQESGEIPT